MGFLTAAGLIGGGLLAKRALSRGPFRRWTDGGAHGVYKGTSPTAGSARPDGLTWNPFSASYNNAQGQAWLGQTGEAEGGQASHVFGEVPSFAFQGDARAQRPGGNWGSPQLGGGHNKTPATETPAKPAATSQAPLGLQGAQAYNQARSFNPWLGGASLYGSSPSSAMTGFLPQLF